LIRAVWGWREKTKRKRDEKENRRKKEREELLGYREERNKTHKKESKESGNKADLASQVAGIEARSVLE
jgi:hypothetical protein